MIARTLVAALGALLASGAVAEAQEGSIRIAGGSIEIRAGFRRPAPVRRVWVPGRYVTRIEMVWVAGRFVTTTTPAEFREWRDPCGRLHRLLVRPAGTKRVWVSGHYRTQEVRVWVPGHYEVVRVPAPRGVPMRACTHTRPR